MNTGKLVPSTASVAVHQALGSSEYDMSPSTTSAAACSFLTSVEHVSVVGAGVGVADESDLEVGIGGDPGRTTGAGRSTRTGRPTTAPLRTTGGRTARRATGARPSGPTAAARVRSAARATGAARARSAISTGAIPALTRGAAGASSHCCPQFPQRSFPRYPRSSHRLRSARPSRRMHHHLACRYRTHPD